MECSKFGALHVVNALCSIDEMFKFLEDIDSHFMVVKTVDFQIELFKNLTRLKEELDTSKFERNQYFIDDNIWLNNYNQIVNQYKLLKELYEARKAYLECDKKFDAFVNCQKLLSVK